MHHTKPPHPILATVNSSDNGERTSSCFTQLQWPVLVLVVMLNAFVISQSPTSLTLTKPSLSLFLTFINTRNVRYQSQFIVNPKPFLADLVGKQVLVKLKWGHMEYQGTLNSSDSYMNLYLERTEEIIDGQFAGFLGDVLIRCNNVLYLKAAPAEE